MEGTPSSPDIALRYMTRFHCIGPACENNCCWGWRIIIDKANYEKMEAVTRHSETERVRFKKAFRLLKKGERNLSSWAEIKLRPDGLCPMLEEDGLCHIHKTYGEEYLSNTCSSYPKHIRRIGDFHLGEVKTPKQIRPWTKSTIPELKTGGHLELSAVASCPELARQLLLHQDAVDVVPFDRKQISRLIIHPGIDPRDRRPYWRYLREVRDLMMQLVRNSSYPLEKRLFFMCYFANRTMGLLNKNLMESDADAVNKEIRLFLDPLLIDEVARRFEGFETPASLVVLLAKTVLRIGSARNTRTSLRDLTNTIFTSYIPADDSQINRQTPKRYTIDTLPTEHIHSQYLARKARVLETAGWRVDQYLTNFAAHYWFHYWQTDSPNLLIHMLRLLSEMAVQKFLLFSHPCLQEALDALAAGQEVPSDITSQQTDTDQKQPPDGESSAKLGSADSTDATSPSDQETPPQQQTETAAPPTQTTEPLTGPEQTEHPDSTSAKDEQRPEKSEPIDFIEILDKVAVEVVYKTSAFMEHGDLLRTIEKMLAKNELMGLAGAVYLVKF